MSILPFQPRAIASDLPVCDAEIIQFHRPMAADEERPFYELPPGPMGSVSMYPSIYAPMYPCENDYARIDVDGVFPADIGLQVCALMLAARGVEYFHSTESGRNIGVVATVPIGVAEAIIELLNPPTMAA